MSEDVLYSHGQKVRIKLALKYAQMCSLLLDQGIIVVIPQQIIEKIHVYLIAFNNQNCFLFRSVSRQGILHHLHSACTAPIGLSNI